MRHNTWSIISNRMSLSFLTGTTKQNVMISEFFNRFIDQDKGEIEAWSQRGSGWVIEGILGTFVHVALYEPFRGGSCFPLPKKF